MLGNPKYIFIAFFTFLVIQPCSAQIFKEVGEEVDIQHQQIFSALMGGGVAFFDFDNDGDQDIYLTGGESRDRLYLNKGGWEFEEIGAQVGLIITENMVTTGVTTGDIDNDGVREIFVTSFNSENFLFKKNDQGVLENVAPEANIIERMASTAASFGDFNLDGFLDLYVVNHLKMNGVILDNNNIPIGFDPICLPNHIYFNNGDGSFTEMAEVLGVNDDGCGLAVSITDFDHDHDVDLLIANDFGEWLNPNIAFSNNYPATTFDDVSTVTGFDAAIYAMGIAPGDYDLDGDLDYYITNLGRNILLQNNGLGQFLDVASEAKVENTYVSDLFATGWGTAFFDYDNDLYPDLFVSNGEIPTFEFVGNAEYNPNKLFHNLGNGKFEDVSEIEGVDEGTRARGFAYADLDQDGDLDMIVGVVARSILNDEKFLVYRNEQTNNYNWLNVNIEGTISNRDGYGSLITLYIDGKKLIREVDGGSSHGSQHSSVIHYGLGNHTRADSLIITWPGGKRTIIRGFDVSQELFVKEKNTKIIISNKIGRIYQKAVFAPHCLQALNW
jgi:hypothetical protein